MKSCWGPDAVNAADRTQNVTEACDSVVEPLSKDRPIMVIFKRVGKGKVLYSHRQHTKTEAKYVPSLTYIYIWPQNNRAEIIRWVTESVQPFEIIKDRCFQSLMKTGRPEYYIPSPSTVSHDVRMVFSKTQQRIAKLLQVSKRICPKNWKLTQKKKGIQWCTKLHDRCMDFAEPQGLCCSDCSPWAEWCTTVPSIRCHRGRRGMKSHTRIEWYSQHDACSPTLDLQ
jgi:hypothetical protein